MAHTHMAAPVASSIEALLILAALLYSLGWIRIHRRGSEAIEVWRAISFFGGLLIIGIALASPVAALDHELLTAHMVQHLLLMTLAPAFTLLGAPWITLLYASPQQLVSSVIVPVFRWPPARRLGKVLGQPAFCWIAATVTLVGWHIPALFRLGLHSEVWHVVEHTSFLTAGFLFWSPVIRPWPNAATRPEWSTILYILLATVPCDILSGFLVFCDRVVYTVYLSTPQHFGISPLEDQQRAGALMWTCVTLAYLVAAAIVAVRLLSMRSGQEHELMQPVLTTPVATHTGPQSMEVA